MGAGTESATRRADPSESASLGNGGGHEGAELEEASGEEYEGAEHEGTGDGGDSAEREGAEHEGAGGGDDT